MEKESSLLPSCTDANSAFLEVIGRQAGEETEFELGFLPGEWKLTNVYI